MKKCVLLFLTTVMISAQQVSAKNIEIMRRGSADGVHYDKVAESHTLFKDKLTCTNPGAISCGWSTSQFFGTISVDQIESYVLAEVAKGNNSGSTKYNGEVLVTWSYGMASDELIINMTDEF